MYKVIFYKNEKGEEPVKDYLDQIAEKKNKSNRIKYNKLQEYIQILAIFGTRAGKPYMKYLRDGIWELRPLKDRILFFHYTSGYYVLLHCFEKTTNKTPEAELEKAKQNKNSFIERCDANE